MSIPKYGAREGLPDRLDYWIERFAKDKTFPWVGTGIVADLKAAAAVIRGEPEKPPIVEFDL